MLIHMKIFFFIEMYECQSWRVPSCVTFRGYVIPKPYHVTAVTVHMLDGIEARTTTYYNDSSLR
jgi:hypothetical protein